MGDTLISFKTAKLAKEKGFNIHTNFMYMSKNVKGCLIKERDLTTLPGANIAAPTQSLLQKWLREVHKIHIVIIPKMIPSGETVYYVFKGKLKKRL